MPGNPHPVPFKKTGVEANPHGRPKKEWTLSGLLRTYLDDKILNPEGKKEVAKQLLTKKLFELALAGDVVAIKEIYNRIDGMPRQPIDATITLPIPIYGAKAVGDTEEV